MLYMAERRRPQRENGRAYLRVGDNLDAEDVCEPGPAVVTKRTENEVFAFLIEDENTGQHSAFLILSDVELKGEWTTGEGEGKVEGGEEKVVGGEFPLIVGEALKRG